MKTTITVEAELYKEFSKKVIKERGLRKKNEVIVELIQKFVDEHREKPEGFAKPCRFGGTCIDEKQYEGCVDDDRMKNNWMCWRDGILRRENMGLEVIYPIERHQGQPPP